MFLQNLGRIVATLLMLMMFVQIPTQKTSTPVDYIRGYHVCRSEKSIWILMHALKHNEIDGFTAAFALLEETNDCWLELGHVLKINTLYTDVTFQKGRTGYVEFVVDEYSSISTPQSTMMILGFTVHQY